ncbi:hypothetical protein NKI94_29600 [Mesorhizobium australicum]|uniref:hypothetical protein n=1 Tax=Mesorhizobium australicum TaxID=536018 RepID=UPI0033371480
MLVVKCSVGAADKNLWVYEVTDAGLARVRPGLKPVEQAESNFAFCRKRPFKASWPEVYRLEYRDRARRALQKRLDDWPPFQICLVIGAGEQLGDGSGKGIAQFRVGRAPFQDDVI